MSLFRFVCLLCCFHVSVWGEMTLQVFATPIKAGKEQLLRDSARSNRDFDAFFAQLEISDYQRWIQKIHDRSYLIHQIKSESLNHSLALLREQISQNHPAAISLQNLYQEALGIDIAKENWVPKTNQIMKMVSVDIDHPSDTLIKEYSFIYPLIPTKKEKLQRMYQDEAVDNSPERQEIYRFRGISKMQLWTQESPNESYVVLYQEITGPVQNARRKYLDSKGEKISNEISAAFSDITGLSYEQLLPQLESLKDFEHLK